MIRPGTKVLVTRGSSGRPKGKPGCLRKVRGVVINVTVRGYDVELSEDDPLDTVGWKKKGDVGSWGTDAVRRAK